MYKTVILPLVLHECETLTLTLREEHRLRVLENRLPRRIFGPKRGGTIGGGRKLHNGYLRNLHSSPNIIIRSRKMRLDGPIACMRKKRNARRILVGKPEGKRLLRILDVGADIILKCFVDK
jgi:hypothetical protein